MTENRALHNPQDPAWQLLAEFSPTDEPGRGHELAEQVTVLVEPLGLRPAQTRGIRQAICGAVRKSSRHSLPLVVRIWISGSVTHYPSTVGLETAHGGCLEHRSWGLFVVEKQVDDPQAADGATYLSAELFLYRET